MFTRILVPLDGSALAESVLPTVTQLALDFKAAIVLMRVHVPSYVPYLADTPYSLIEISRREEEECRAYLEATAVRLRNRGLTVDTIVHEGNPADAILDAVSVAQADLIAMTTHGRSGVGRWLLGSVADRVVHGASVPILLTRGLATKPVNSKLIEEEEAKSAQAGLDLGTAAAAVMNLH